jgi:hypothetical protein
LRHLDDRGVTVVEEHIERRGVTPEGAERIEGRMLPGEHGGPSDLAGKGGADALAGRGEALSRRSETVLVLDIARFDDRAAWMDADRARLHAEVPALFKKNDGIDDRSGGQDLERFLPRVAVEAGQNRKMARDALDSVGIVERMPGVWRDGRNRDVESSENPRKEATAPFPVEPT